MIIQQVNNKVSQLRFLGNLILALVLPEGILLFLWHSCYVCHHYQMTSNSFESGTHPSLYLQETPVSWAGINPFQTDLWWCKYHERNHSWDLFPQKSFGNQLWFGPDFDTFCAICRMSHGCSSYRGGQVVEPYRAMIWPPSHAKTW